ncbi:MAG TPA: hypothetical protein VGP07_25580 [Polyangia bacterium]|jgi:non-specific serine/threonine protein kinase
MNANHRVGVEDDEAGRFLDPSCSGSATPSETGPRSVFETVYVGRASFRMALDQDVILPPVADASSWFTPPPANVMQGAPNHENADDFLPSEPIVGEVAVAGRSWKWVKPTSWLIVAVPLVAFSLGMLVSPLSRSTRIARARLMEHLGARAGARTTAAPIPSVVPPSTLPAASAMVVTPLPLAAAETHPAPQVEAHVVAPSSVVTTASLAHGHAPKLRASRKAAGRDRSSSQDVASSPRSTAAERDDVAPSPAGVGEAKAGKAPAAKPWVDPWAS